MSQPDYRHLCQALLRAVDKGDEDAGQDALNQIRAGLAQGHNPNDGDLLALLRNHPLRTNIVRAAKEMAEYHDDAGRGARQVDMLMNTVDYARLVLKVYGRHDA